MEQLGIYLVTIAVALIARFFMAKNEEKLKRARQSQPNRSPRPHSRPYSTATQPIGGASTVNRAPQAPLGEPPPKFNNNQDSSKRATPPSASSPADDLTEIERTLHARKRRSSENFDEIKAEEMPGKDPSKIFTDIKNENEPSSSAEYDMAHPVVHEYKTLTKNQVGSPDGKGLVGKLGSAKSIVKKTYHKKDSLPFFAGRAQKKEYIRQAVLWKEILDKPVSRRSKSSIYQSSSQNPHQ